MKYLSIIAILAIRLLSFLPKETISKKDNVSKRFYIIQNAINGTVIVECHKGGRLLYKEVDNPILGVHFTQEY